MIRKTFGDFVDKKKRDAKHQLELVEKLLKKKGLKTENFLDREGGDDPYIFCFNPQKNTSFDGVRIYKIGNFVAFRIQKESKTHPYGQAYSIQIEEMYNDFLTDKDAKPHDAGKKVIEAVAKEIKKFFEKCQEAEKDQRRDDVEKQKDPSGNIAMRTQGTDYSSLIYSKA